jgi:hypothetical protein
VISSGPDRDKRRRLTNLRQLKKLLVPAAVLIVVISALLTYMFRGGFHQFEITTYKVPRAAFTTWNDV